SPAIKCAGQSPVLHAHHSSPLRHGRDLRNPGLNASPGPYAELAAAVARASRVGAVTEAQRDAILARLTLDFPRLQVIELRASMLAIVPELVVRHPLRGYDAVQLATALHVQSSGTSVAFWSTDETLRVKDKSRSSRLGEPLQAWNCAGARRPARHPKESPPVDPDPRTTRRDRLARVHRARLLFGRRIHLPGAIERPLARVPLPGRAARFGLVANLLRRRVTVWRRAADPRGRLDDQIEEDPCGQCAGDHEGSRPPASNGYHRRDPRRRRGGRRRLGRRVRRFGFP